MESERGGDGGVAGFGGSRILEPSPLSRLAGCRRITMTNRETMLGATGKIPKNANNKNESSRVHRVCETRNRGGGGGGGGGGDGAMPMRRWWWWWCWW